MHFIHTLFMYIIHTIILFIYTNLNDFEYAASFEFPSKFKLNYINLEKHHSFPFALNWLRY